MPLILPWNSKKALLADGTFSNLLPLKMLRNRRLCQLEHGKRQAWQNPAPLLLALEKLNMNKEVDAKQLQ